MVEDKEVWKPVKDYEGLYEAIRIIENMFKAKLFFIWTANTTCQV